jgi:hypothetical protein
VWPTTRSATAVPLTCLASLPSCRFAAVVSAALLVANPPTVALTRWRTSVATPLAGSF